MTSREELRHRFTYHAPSGQQPEVYEQIRGMGFQFAGLIDEWCVESREKALALTKVEEAVMWANASIARHGLNEGRDAGTKASDR